MADPEYWSEVDRQPKELTPQAIQELNYLISILPGKRQSAVRLRTRVKWLVIGVTIIGGLNQAWDWIKGLWPWSH